MEFRLIYEGALPAEGGTSRVTEKHTIRRMIHRQMRELWERDQFLNRLRTERFRLLDGGIKLGVPPGTPLGGDVTTEVDMIANTYTQSDYRFVPLVQKKYGLACALDILFLRRDNPGDIIRHGGDVDNRIKVLFDALRIPENSAELGGESPQEGEDPLFCLLEDDALVTQVKVTTDRLLKPQREGEGIHEVCLVVHVTTKIVNFEIMPRGFMS